MSDLSRIQQILLDVTPKDTWTIIAEYIISEDMLVDLVHSNSLTFLQLANKELIQNNIDQKLYYNTAADHNYVSIMEWFVSVFEIANIIHIFRSACISGHIGVVQIILTRWIINPDISNSALTCACSAGQLSVVKLLIAHIGKENVKKNDLLWHTCIGGQEKVIKWLLDEFKYDNLDMIRPDGPWLSPLSLVIQANKRMADWLVKKFNISKDEYAWAVVQSVQFQQ